jgi:hypothetical protein
MNVELQNVYAATKLHSGFAMKEKFKAGAKEKKANT